MEQWSELLNQEFSAVHWRRGTVQSELFTCPWTRWNGAIYRGRTGHAIIVTRWMDVNFASAIGSRRRWRQGRVPEVCPRSGPALVGKGTHGDQHGQMMIGARLRAMEGLSVICLYLANR